MYNLLLEHKTAIRLLCFPALDPGVFGYCSRTEPMVRQTWTPHTSMDAAHNEIQSTAWKEGFRV
jgi:hypothetical protein